MFIRDDDDYGDLNVDQIREKGLGTSSINKDIDTTTASTAAPLPDCSLDGSPSHGTITGPNGGSGSPDTNTNASTSPSASPGQNASSSSPSTSPGPSASPSASPGAGVVVGSKRSKSRHSGKGKSTDNTALASLANDGE